MPSKLSNINNKNNARKLENPKYKSFRLSKRIKPQAKKTISGSFMLLYLSSKTIIKNWKIFSIFSLIYLIVNFVFVRSFSVSVGATEIKSVVKELIEGRSGEIAATFTAFGSIVGGSSFAADDTASVYQVLFLLIFSLAAVWILRQIEAKKRANLRGAFYESMNPLIPLFFIMIVIGLQLIPLYLSGFLYTLVYGGGIAVTTLEKIIWALLLFLLALLSLYLITSSIFALYIVTLPKMRPLEALKYANNLVAHRRLIIMRKLLFLPFAMIFMASAIILPLIIISPSLAEWVYLFLSAIALVLFHSYMYRLYRELM